MTNPIVFIKNIIQKEEDFQKRLLEGITKAVDIVVNEVKKNEQLKLQSREEELVSEYEFKLAQQKHEYQSELVEKDVINEQYVRMINDLQRRIENCQKAYQTYFHSSLEIKRSSVEMTDQMKKTLDENGNLWKGFARIRDNILNTTDEMIQKDGILRELLGMGSSEKKLLIDKNKK